VFLDEYISSTLVKVSDAHKVTLGNDYFIIKKKKFTAINNSLQLLISMWDTLHCNTKQGKTGNKQGNSVMKAGLSSKHYCFSITLTTITKFVQYLHVIESPSSRTPVESLGSFTVCTCDAMVQSSPEFSVGLMPF
jgi:hypothetical protein